MAKAQAAQDAGMAKPELRKHVIMARRKPLHIAFALGGNGRPIIVMHPRTAPRAIEKQIKDEAKDSKNHRFGLLRFDEDEPSIARIVVNKPAAGMAKKLIVALKGTGVRQIELLMEDGTSVESAMNDDEDDETGDQIGDEGADDGAPAQDAGTATDGQDDESGTSDAGAKAEATGYPTTADASMPEAAPAAKDDAAPAEPDANSLKQDLTGMVKRMIAVIGADPTQKAVLVELATDAQASLKRGDLQQAAAGIAVFGQALDAATGADADADPGTDADPAAPDAAAADRQPAAATPAHGKAAVQRYRKSRMVWTATRAKVDADLQKLSSTIAGFDHGGRFGDDIGATFLKTIDPVLSTLDDSLSGLLAQAEQAQDQDEADQALEQARITIGLYQDFTNSNDLIKQVDSNPFLPMAIGKTLNASLAVLAASMH